MADFLLSVGVDVGLSYAEMQKDISSLVADLNKNPPLIKIKIDTDGVLENVRNQINELNKSIGNSGSGVKATKASGASKTTQEFRDAKRAIDDYYRTLSQLNKTQSDITLNGKEWKSASGNYNELADALNRTKTAYDLVVNSMQSMPAEQQASLQAQLTKRQNEYNLAVEQQANKERLAAEATAIRTQRLQEAKVAAQAEAEANRIARAEERQNAKTEVANARNGEKASLEQRNAATKSYLNTVIKLESAIEKWSQAENSKNVASREAYRELGRSLDTLRGEYSKLGSKPTVGQVNELNDAVSEANVSFKTQEGIIKANGDATRTLSDRMGSLASKFSAWLSVSQVVMLAYRSIRQMITNVIELDTAMTELKKVTDESDATYNKFLENATVRAKNLGAALSDTVTATADFARLGFTIEDAEKLADTAIVYKNVGDGIENISDASESIIATMQAFGVAADDAMSIVDKFNEVGNRYAISSEGVGEALLRSAAAMKAANNTLDETIALATAANTVVQDPEKVGTTLKTLSMYLRAAKTEAEDAGESTEGMADSVSKLRSEILALTGNRVDIQVDEDSFKSTFQILKELSGVWKDLTDITKANILEMVGGKRNSNVVAALLENFSVAEKAVQTSADSAGSALAENEKYLNSINGKINQFKATFQDFSQNLISSETVKQAVNIGTILLKIFNVIVNIVNAVGGLNSVLAITATYLVISKWSAIQSFISKLTTNFAVFGATFRTAYEAAILEGATANQAFALSLKGVTAAWTASPFFLATVAIVAIAGIIKVVDALTESAEEAAEKLKDIKQEYSENQSKISGLNDELETTRKRIDELQKKGTLSFTEQTELERLQKQNSELERELHLLELRQKILNKDKNNAFVNAMKKSFDTYTNMMGVSTSITNRQMLDSYLASWKSENAKLSNDKLTENERKKIQKQLSVYEKYIEEQVADMVEKSDGISYIISPSNSDERAVNEWLDYINDIQDRMAIAMGGENAKSDAFSRVIDNWKFNETVQGLQDLGETGKVTADMLDDPKYADFIQKLIELGVISDTTPDSMKLVALAFNTLGKDAEKTGAKIEKATSELKSFKDVAAGVESLSDGLEKLDKIYADIVNGEDFDFGSILNDKDFEEKFGNLGDAYDNFIKTVSNNSGNIEACQQAFNDLTTEYINQSGVLSDVTDETRNATVTMLEQMGVANAAIVVDAQLALNKEKLANASRDLSNVTIDEINATLNSKDASETAKMALAQLWLQKLNLNSTKLDFNSDIDQIINIANAAGAGAAALAKLEQAKGIVQRANAEAAKGTSAGFHMIDSQEYADAQEVLKQVANGTFDYKFNILNSSSFKSKTYYSGGSATRSAQSAASKAAEKAAAKQKTWFELQLAEHKHLVAMEKESQQSYLNWLNSAYQQAYNEGILELDDYRKYQEEVFEGLRDVFKDYLSDIEHEISMRENYDGESKKIIELYQKLIAEVEREIGSARAQGLSDSDDYIQELQEKWQKYKNSIEDIRNEITDNAKDALEDLIDYRVDMLKKDIENEKDALNKKLDYLKEFYDKQKEMLQDKYDEEKYLQEQSEKRKSVTDLQAEISMLENDNSAWAQKRRLELQAELSDAENDLADFEKENALDKALDAIDAAYNSQEAQLEREMDALEEKLNDPNALYNQALQDIRNNSKNQLYYQMLMYNRQYGDGKDETVNTLWESAYGALNEYEKLFGKLYNEVKLKNETGVKEKPGWDSQNTSGGGTSAPTPTQANAKAQSFSSAPSLSSGSTVQVKKSATHFGSKSKSRKMASFVPGGSYTVYQTSGDQVLIGRNGVYTGWVKKSDIVGYASGTKHATAGLHELYEQGSETLFVSGDGSKYRILNNGDKVLNAKATDFLYDFANGGENALARMLKNVFGGSLFGGISPAVTNNEINMGDIIIRGSADSKTVSEIRREQRSSVDYMLRMFNKLNKQ